MGMAQHYTPEEYMKNDFGKVGIPFEAIKVNMDGFSDIFSEGSTELKKLLLLMWGNNIETIGCCVGHERAPLCYKDTLFGDKEITPEEYDKHKNSSRYHCYSRDKRSYFSFKVDCDGNSDAMQELQDILREELDNVSPQLPIYSVFVRQNNVHHCEEANIFLDAVPSKPEVERFFSCLNKVISNVFCLDGLEGEREQDDVLIGDVDGLILEATATHNRGRGLVSQFGMLREGRERC